MLRTIDRISVQPGLQLLLYYTTGEEVLADFKPIMERGGVFAALADPQFFRQVELGEHGRYIEWPGNLDFCADALWEEGQHLTLAAHSRIAETGKT